MGLKENIIMVSVDKIVIKIRDGLELELTIEEARQLKCELNALLYEPVLQPILLPNPAIY